MSDKNTSSLQAVVDQVTGVAQSALGAITGNTADKQAGENKQATADAKNDLSHTGATIGGVSVSSSGVAANDPNRQAGAWDQTVGSGKQALGGLVGHEGLKKEGAQQYDQGQAKEAQGQLSDLGSGIANRVGGTIGGAVAGVTGDRDEQARQQAKHDEGKTLQRGVESELDKKADA